MVIASAIPLSFHDVVVDLNSCSLNVWLMEDHFLSTHATWVSLVEDYLIKKSSDIDTVLLFSLHGDLIHSFGCSFNISQEEFGQVKALLTTNTAESQFVWQQTKYTVVNRASCSNLYATSHRRQSGVSVHLLDQAILCCIHNKKVVPSGFCETAFRFASLLSSP